MIEMLDIIPVEAAPTLALLPYRDPSGQRTVVLATKEGNSQLWWSVTIKKPILNWGPDNMMRLEGVTSYKGERCQVIAWYRLDSVEDKLGTMQLHAPE